MPSCIWRSSGFRIRTSFVHLVPAAFVRLFSVHDCDYHKYADDTELSKGASPDQFDSVQSCIQTYIGDVLIWMNSNKLKLNTDKTEVMPAGSASRVALVESECTNIG